MVSAVVKRVDVPVASPLSRAATSWTKRTAESRLSWRPVDAFASKYDADDLQHVDVRRGTW
jgi:hypothetical protein